MIRKMIGLRIFEDENGKTNLSLSDVGGNLLLCLPGLHFYANCKKGNRPSFIEAGSPEKANELYEYIITKCKESVPVVEQGSFGADMKVSLLNDGPFTDPFGFRDIVILAKVEPLKIRLYLSILFPTFL